MARKDACLPKDMGVLGVRSPSLFNHAALAKAGLDLSN